MADYNGVFKNRDGDNLYPTTKSTEVKYTRGTITSVNDALNNLYEAIAEKAGSRVVNNISERDALTNVHIGDIVYVVNAVGDPTVSSGGATYIKTNAVAWTKIAEWESMDLRITWDRVENKPDFATVAFSGKYGALINKPTIPIVDQTYSATSNNAMSGVALATIASESSKRDSALVEESGTPPTSLREDGFYFQITGTI